MKSTSEIISIIVAQLGHIQMRVGAATHIQQQQPNHSQFRTPDYITNNVDLIYADIFTSVLYIVAHSDTKSVTCIGTESYEELEGRYKRIRQILASSDSFRGVTPTNTLASNRKSSAGVHDDHVLIAFSLKEVRPTAELGRYRVAGDIVAFYDGENQAVVNLTDDNQEKDTLSICVQ